MLLIAGFFALVLSSLTLATPVGDANIVARAGDAIDAQVFKNVSWTSYVVGIGDCGRTNVPTDFVVALNTAQYGKGERCFETIQMSYNGKSTTATIVDYCPFCPTNGLDLSQGLFAFFTPLPFGYQIFGDWYFLDEKASIVRKDITGNSTSPGGVVEPETL